MTITNGDFVEIEYTARANGEIFDSNRAIDLAKIDPKAKPRKTIAIIGESTVIKGLDNALEGKELGKEYTVSISAKDGFGDRRPDLVKTIPLSVFTSQNIRPERGMTLMLDNNVVTIRTVSGARVITDFNNPMAGKELEYTFIALRKVEDLKGKAEAFFECFFGGAPELEVGESVILRGPKELEVVVTMTKERFKKLVGKELEFKVKEEKPAADQKESTQQSL